MLRHKLQENLSCSHTSFCWHQVLTSSFDWFILPCSHKFSRVFRWQQVLTSSLDWFILPCSHEFSRVFRWHQVLTSSVDWFILTCSYKFFRVFCWQQVLVSSFDLLILLSVTLAIGPDVRRWPEYETLLRATPPKLNTSSNVFGGTNSCEQVVWIYF